MTVYVDVDDLKKSLTLDGTTFADEDIELAVAATSEALEEELNRDFGKSDEDTVRLYSPEDRDLLFIDDLVELGTVRVDRTGDGTWETWTLDSDFRLEPLNAETDGKPWTAVRALAAETFPLHRYALVEVTGVFGWPSPPQRIIAAAGIIASQLVKRKREAPFGFVISEEAAAYITRNDPQVASLLKGLGRRKLFASVQLG